MAYKDLTNEQRAEALLSSIRWFLLQVFFNILAVIASFITMVLAFTDTDPLPFMILAIGSIILMEYASRMSKSAHKEGCPNCSQTVPKVTRRRDR